MDFSLKKITEKAGMVAVAWITGMLLKYYMYEQFINRFDTAWNSNSVLTFDHLQIAISLSIFDEFLQIKAVTSCSTHKND